MLPSLSIASHQQSDISDVSRGSTYGSIRLGYTTSYAEGWHASRSASSYVFQSMAPEVGVLLDDEAAEACS